MTEEHRSIELPGTRGMSPGAMMLWSSVRKEDAIRHPKRYMPWHEDKGVPKLSEKRIVLRGTDEAMMYLRCIFSNQSLAKHDRDMTTMARAPGLVHVAEMYSGAWHRPHRRHDVGMDVDVRLRGANCVSLAGSGIWSGEEYGSPSCQRAARLPWLNAQTLCPVSTAHSHASAQAGTATDQRAHKRGLRGMAV